MIKKHLRVRAFANTELVATRYSPETTPEEEEPIQDNKLDWINLAWERPTKGKKHALDNKVGPKKNIGPA